MRAGRYRLGRLTVLAALIFSALSAGGCAEPGFIAHVIAGPDHVKARYTLEPRPTLVIVDDPQNALGDPNFPAVVGANVGHNLIQNEVLDAGLVVSQDHLSSLAVQLGDRYPTTPIDRIGTRLKAQQVIYVRVISVKMQIAGAYYHPTAVVEVKVIDAQTGSRLFPKAGEYSDPETTPPGLTFPIEMKRQTLDENRRHARSMLARSLAERIGLEVAQIFYDHLPIDNSLGQ